MGDGSAIILAARLSRRMGAQHKLLLAVGNVPMIRRMIRLYRAAMGRRVGRHQMKALRDVATRLRRKCALTPEQAEHLVKIKFPCC